MIIRSLQAEDLNQLKEIHAQFYKHEFEFPNFLDKFECVFVVVDDSEKIITGGGVRTILESVLLTDKSFAPRIRREALYNMLQGSTYVGEKLGYKEIHAFIQDDRWSQCLKKIGFKNTVGESLVFQFER